MNTYTRKRMKKRIRAWRLSVGRTTNRFRNRARLVDWPHVVALVAQAAVVAAFCTAMALAVVESL